MVLVNSKFNSVGICEMGAGPRDRPSSRNSKPAAARSSCGPTTAVKPDSVFVARAQGKFGMIRQFGMTGGGVGDPGR